MDFGNLVVRKLSTLTAREYECIKLLDLYFKFFTDNSIESFRRFLDVNGKSYITNEIIKKVANVVPGKGV